MKRNLTCIICPRGCSLEVTIENGSATVTGNACPKGAQYGADECTHPTRTVTSTVRVANRTDVMVSVKTATPIPKDQMAQAMRQIRALRVDAPVAIGDVLAEDVCGAKLVATCPIQ